MLNNPSIAQYHEDSPKPKPNHNQKYKMSNIPKEIIINKYIDCFLC